MLSNKIAYKLTGFAVLIIGILFFLRDIDPVKLNIVGNTTGWTIFIVLIGAGLLAGELNKSGAFKSKGK